MRRLGHRVRILERSPTPLLHDQGAGIVYGEETRQFFARYDLTRTPIFVTSKERLYLDKLGEIVYRQHSQQQMTSWDLLYHVLRANFDGHKNDYVKEVPKQITEDAERGYAVYQHGSLVTGLEETSVGATVSWKSTLPGHDGEVEEPLLADSVIVADGSSSAMRPILSPSSPTKTYAGYVAFRGTVPESELSPEAAAVFSEKFAFYHSGSIQILAYLIPGRHGSLEKGQRLTNWVWYWNVEQDSDEFKSIFTDKDGKLHRFTLPPGDNMDRQVWNAQKQHAQDLLPPQFTELVHKTRSPFVQAITDLPPPTGGRSWYMDHKAVLVGDAMAGFRPHTAGSTSQAASHALMLPEVRGVFSVDGAMMPADYGEEARMHAVSVQRIGVQLGERSQFGRHPLQR